MEVNRNNLQVKYTLRRAIPSDASGIIAAHEASWIAAYCNEDFHITEEKISTFFANKEERLARWENRIKQADWTGNGVWVAVDEQGHILGFVAPKIEHEKARVGAIYLRPEVQGKGIGSLLLEEVKKLYAHHSIYLDVVSYNHKAIEFYKKHGFRATGAHTMFTFEHEGQVLLEMPVEEYVLNTIT